ncbi:hypothetical protein MAPG_10710 [Magnaporthiopsis poae ATCC 64411]|uniref:Uncharacterized protein n=1 Tax=Magnaporthiopsis poae (strain ATCC 64411 / 73-15) TaxID=644358 RepID=A0A0C4EDB5_MAGP6|nr:hypothetical protein MAPG_10710 [Magnaporthiopsis poae ATCC 64411]
MIEFPKDSDEWFILGCDTHGTNFKTNVLANAYKHLRREHNGMLRSDAHSAKQFGLRIPDCDQARAEENNRVFGQAQPQKQMPKQKGKKGRKQKGRRRTGYASSAARRTRQPPENASSAARSTRQPSEMPEPVSDPVVGTPYSTSLMAHRYAVLVLPTGPLGLVGTSKTLADTKLAEGCITARYRFNPQSRQILGWAVGFEDGGPRISERRFPIMYSKGDHYSPSGGSIPETPRDSSLGWKDAQSLEPLELRDTDDRSVTGAGVCPRIPFPVTVTE